MVSSAVLSSRGDWFKFRQHPGEAIAAEDVIEDHDNRHAGRNCVCLVRCLLTPHEPEILFAMWIL